MKAKLHVLTAAAVALGATLATAQDERKPESPPPIRERQPEARREPEGERPGVRRAQPSRPAAFLGVATSPVSPALAAQLGLPAGFGLVVDEVMPDSPAGKAGVQRFDVLRLFNDQQLTDPRQLAALVRAQGSETDVTLTLLRKGQEQWVGMKIAERPMPERVPFPRPAGEVRERIERMQDGVGDKLRRMQEQARDFEWRLREYQERLKNWRGAPGTEIPKPPEFHPSDEAADRLREDRPSAPAKERRIESRSSSTDGTANAKVVMKDESGWIEVTSTDGRRHLVAKNAKGEVIFDGPIDTPEQIRALPEDLRKKVERIEVRTKVEATEPSRPQRRAEKREEPQL